LKRAPILKSLRTDIDAATIPASGKRRLREVLKKMNEEIFALEKKRKKEAEAKAKVAFQTALGQADKDGRTCFVVRMELTTKDSKIAGAILKKTLKKRKDLSVLVVASVDGVDGVFCLANVSKTHVKAGLKANEWVDAALNVCGKSRGGGRDSSAQGTGKDANKTGAAIDAASDVAKKYH